MPSTAIATAFVVISLLAAALTVIRLWQTKLYRKYPVFFCFFIFLTPNLAWPLVFGVNSSIYFYFWLTLSPVSWLFHIAMVAELYGLILKKYRGLYTLGRWAMYVSTVIAIGLSILSLIPKFTPAMPQRSRHIGYFYAIDRGIDFSLVLFIFLILLFLSLYPVPISRNTAVHVALFTVYFLSSTLSVLARTVTGRALTDQVNLVFSAVSTLCFVGWAFLLTPRGESVPAKNPIFGPEHEARVLRHLEALNATLLKVGRN
jgi:hypothetical protein